MNLSNLKRASDHDVEQWLEKRLALTPYQKDKLHQEEIVRFSRFHFYERRDKENVSFLWRFTVVFFPICWLLLFCLLPINMIITGKWGYGRWIMDSFFSKWKNKLNL
jgi:hypothetical protein